MHSYKHGVSSADRRSSLVLNEAFFLPLFCLAMTFWLFWLLNSNHVISCKSLEMTIAPNCQVVSCDVNPSHNFPNFAFFPSIFFPSMGMYMCKYDFVFVTPTRNPFHWLSLARACVLYRVGLGSHRGHFPVGLPKAALESCTHFRSVHNWLAILYLKWYIRVLKMTLPCRLEKVEDLKLTFSQRKGCAPRRTEFICRGRFGWWRYFLDGQGLRRPLAEAELLLQESTCCNVRSQSNYKLASKLKGSELYSDPFSIGSTFSAITVESRPSDPVSVFCRVNRSFFLCFCKGLLAGLDPVLTYRRCWCRQLGPFHLVFYSKALPSTSPNCICYLGFNTHWFILINIVSFTKFVFFL